MIPEIFDRDPEAVAQEAEAAVARGIAAAAAAAKTAAATATANEAATAATTAAASRWRKIGGPTAAVIATLIDAQWQPVTSRHWVAPDGEEWAVGLTDNERGTVWDPTDFLSKITETLNKQLWSRAAQHYNGKGLEGGADAYGLRLHVSKLRKQGRHDYAGALVNVATAAAWTRQRIADLPSQALKLSDADAFEAAITCKRCGLAPETDFHRIWKCKANCELKECKKSVDLVRRAESGVDKLPCLWLRGIVPASWTTDIIPTPPTTTEATEENLGATIGPAGKVTSNNSERLLGCGDGSGGNKSSDPRLRRIGWAWVALNGHNACSLNDIVFTKMSVLAGKRQTVNRGELSALIDFLQSTEGAVTFVTDSGYVMTGVSKERRRAGNRKAKHKYNADLWGVLAPLLTNRDIEVHKVESHLDLNDSTLWLDRYPRSWVLGNTWADTFAAAAAEDAALPSSVLAAVEWIDNIATRIRNRIAATLIDAAEKDPRSVAPPLPKKAVKRKGDVRKQRQKARAENLARTKHTVTKANGQRYTCAVCGETPSAKDVDVWLAKECVTPCLRPFCPDVATPTMGAPVKVGLSTIHPSHTAAYSPALELWFCSTCGAQASKFLKDLATPCAPIKKSGLDNLARIRKLTVKKAAPPAQRRPGSAVQPRLPRLNRKQAPPPGYQQPLRSFPASASEAAVAPADGDDERACSSASPRGHCPPQADSAKSGPSAVIKRNLKRSAVRHAPKKPLSAAPPRTSASADCQWALKASAAEEAERAVFDIAADDSSDCGSSDAQAVVAHCAQTSTVVDPASTIPVSVLSSGSTVQQFAQNWNAICLPRRRDESDEDAQPPQSPEPRNAAEGVEKQALRDLIDLHELGESVRWPDGLDASSARFRLLDLEEDL